MGLSPLYKVQAGKETTWGTTVPGTAIWYPDKIFGFRDGQEQVQPDERRGSFAPHRRSYKPADRPESSGFEGDATFEDLILHLNAAVKTGVITTVNVAGKQHLFVPSTTAANVPTPFSIEFGDNIQAFLAGGCLVKSLSISAKEGEAWKVKSDWFAKSLAPATFTASLAQRAVESILAELTTIFFDDTGGTIGSTIKSAFLVDWEWKQSEHFYPQFHQSGALTASAFGEKMFKPELEVTAAFNADANALRAKFAAGTRQLVRIKATGSNIAGASPATPRSAQIDGAYIVSADPLVLDERDAGESICKISMMAEYDAADATYCGVTLVNAVAALP